MGRGAMVELGCSNLDGSRQHHVDNAAVVPAHLGKVAAVLGLECDAARQRGQASKRLTIVLAIRGQSAYEAGRWIRCLSECRPAMRGAPRCHLAAHVWVHARQHRVVERQLAGRDAWHQTARRHPPFVLSHSWTLLARTARGTGTAGEGCVLPRRESALKRPVDTGTPLECD
jgi:hypothetical protein